MALPSHPELFDHPFLGGYGKVRVGQEVSARELRRAMAAYYAMIENVDDYIGQVLRALEQARQNLDEWIIIYTSDHGEMLGEHGVFEKQKFFEESVRVPLIIRWPQQFTPRRVTQNVNLCDLFATLCDLTQIETPAGLDSRSLVPLLRGETNHWKNETISQFNSRNLMIKWDHYKYQYYGEEIPEVLFDLQKNPMETVNFIADPTCADLIARFRQRRRELGFGPDALEPYVNAGYNTNGSN